MRNNNLADPNKLINELDKQLKNVQDLITKVGLIFSFAFAMITPALSNVLGKVFNDYISAIIIFIYLFIGFMFMYPILKKLYIPDYKNYDNIYHYLYDYKYKHNY